MQGYVVRKGDQHYAVIYERLDSLAGREPRRSHPAGTGRSEAEQLASRLAADWVRDRSPRCSGITVAVYLTQRWLPANQARLKPSTWAGYARNADLHVIPRIGRVSLRHLRPDHIERTDADLAVAGNHVRPGGLDEKTIVEIHQMLRRALGDAARRGLIVTNPAAVALAPRRRPLGNSVAKAWNAYQLRAFLDHTAGHRVHAALWTAANTGMRRGGLAGLHWSDIDLDAATLSVNRSLVSVGYELHESRGKTRTSRRCIDLDSTTVQVLRDWKERRAAEDPNLDPNDRDAQVFAQPDGTVMHPSAVLRRVQAEGPHLGAAEDPAARPSSHARHAVVEGRHAHQVRVRTARPPTPAFTMARTSTCCPACNAKPPRPSPACWSFYRIPPGRSPGRSQAARDEALARTRPDQGFSVAGVGFEPTIFGLSAA